MATKKNAVEEQAAQAEEQAVTAGAETAETAGSTESPAELLSLSALAARHRVPSWQQAALCRYMGWADGKMLTDAEYGSALKQLAARHMGGGRRR